jgi:hypothetical protein
MKNFDISRFEMTVKTVTSIDTVSYELCKTFLLLIGLFNTYI